jgi:hypothetical protein
LGAGSVPVEERCKQASTEWPMEIETRSFQMRIKKSHFSSNTRVRQQSGCGRHGAGSVLGWLTSAASKQSTRIDSDHSLFGTEQVRCWRGAGLVDERCKQAGTEWPMEIETRSFQMQIKKSQEEQASTEWRAAAALQQSTDGTR